MTMQHPIHPDDVRLAALAGDDPEVVADTALRAHVDSCDRCGPMVRDLASLRTALGELPDLVPSRPLQLLPPVAEPKVATGGGWLRRLAGPAMAAGLVLVVVGAIGSTGFNPLGVATSQIFQNVGDNLAAGGDAPEAAASDAERPTDLGPGVQSGASPTGRALFGSDGRPLQASPEAEVTSHPEGVPPGEQGGESAGPFQPADPRLPWLVVLALGVGLLFAGIFLRFTRQPRAG
jgi:hypothetical protein